MLEEKQKLTDYFETVCRYMVTTEVSYNEVSTAIESSINDIFHIDNNFKDDYNIDTYLRCKVIKYFMCNELMFDIFAKYRTYCSNTSNLKPIFHKLVWLQYNTLKKYSKKGIKPFFSLAMLNIFLIILILENDETKLSNIFTTYDNALRNINVTEFDETKFRQNVSDSIKFLLNCGC